jgi:APA family basic amino acid/polyamine antiporter
MPTATGLQAYLLPSIFGIDTRFGLVGIFTGAALVFFAYIGFDIVATTSEEARNPQRDLPIGIFASLGICTLLYILASVVFTGLVPYDTWPPRPRRPRPWRRRPSRPRSSSSL